MILLPGVCLPLNSCETPGPAGPGGGPSLGRCTGTRLPTCLGEKRGSPTASLTLQPYQPLSLAPHSHARAFLSRLSTTGKGLQQPLQTSCSNAALRSTGSSGPARSTPPATEGELPWPTRARPQLAPTPPSPPPPRHLRNAPWGQESRAPALCVGPRCPPLAHHRSPRGHPAPQGLGCCGGRSACEPCATVRCGTRQEARRKGSGLTSRPRSLQTGVRPGHHHLGAGACEGPGAPPDWAPDREQASKTPEDTLLPGRLRSRSTPAESYHGRGNARPPSPRETKLQAGIPDAASPSPPTRLRSEIQDAPAGNHEKGPQRLEGQ